MEIVKLKKLQFIGYVMNSKLCVNYYKSTLFKTLFYSHSPNFLI